jgi:peroxiredoxin
MGRWVFDGGVRIVTHGADRLSRAEPAVWVALWRCGGGRAEKRAILRSGSVARLLWPASGAAFRIAHSTCVPISEPLFPLPVLETAMPSHTRPESPHPHPAAKPGWSRRRWLQATGAASLASALPVALAQPVSAAAEESRAPPMPALGTKLYLPRIGLLDGRVLDPDANRGKPLLVYWWSSTCPFCALQSPSMEKLWLSQRGRGLQMVALSVDKKAQDAQAYLAQKGYSFPAAWTSAEWRKAFPKPKGLPITLLAGRDGQLLLAERGQMFAEDVDAIAQLI